MRLGPIRDLTTFADALRGKGLTVTSDQVSDMARAISLVDAGSRDQVHAGLRALAVTDPEQRRLFDEVFADFFEGGFQPIGLAEQRSKLASASAGKPLIRSLGEDTSTETDSRTGASAVEAIQTRDFADLDDQELAEAKRLVMSMLWQPSDVRTRRWAASSSGPSPDMRRTLRSATRPEGDLMPIVRRRRRLRQRPLIVIADISGSMETYAELFLVFAHAALRRLENVEVFTFSTQLTRITEDLSRRDVAGALASVSDSVTDWSGGTKIGEALGAWNKSWSRRLSRGGPIALILSDGWDCGDPGLLASEMARLARSVHRVVWLNPLAARADYRPSTRGMQAVLPYVGHLLPAATVQDLRGVVRLLDSMSTART